MSSQTAGARPSRTLAAIFEEAVTVLRQDLNEYGYVALVGAFSATIIAAILRMIDTPASLALIVPAVGLIAVGTMATLVAGLERAQSGLQPDPAMSSAEALTRAPWLLYRTIPAVVPHTAAVFVAAALGGHLGGWATLPLVAALVFAGIYMLLPLPAYISALLARDGTPVDATVYGAAMLKSGRAAYLIALSVSLAPALIGALIALLARFGPISTGLLAFTIVISMPLAAAILSLIYAQTAPQLLSGAPPVRQKGITRGSNVATRLDRHVR